MRRTAIPLFVLAAAGTASAQTPITDASLRGVWYFSPSQNSEAVTFAADNEFVYAYTVRKQDGKDIDPTRRTSVGAYKVGDNACTVGSSPGNLFLVWGSSRCCFTGYHMGKLVVLDEVKSSGGPPRLSIGLCSSKTMSREDGSAKK